MKASVTHREGGRQKASEEEKKGPDSSCGCHGGTWAIDESVSAGKGFILAEWLSVSGRLFDYLV